MNSLPKTSKNRLIWYYGLRNELNDLISIFGTARPNLIRLAVLFCFFDNTNINKSSGFCNHLMSEKL